MMLRSVSEKLLLLDWKHKGNNKNDDHTTSNDSSAVQGRIHRFLIIVNVLGGSGPIKFVVKDDDRVAAVIGTALKMYAREERLPQLGHDVNQCLLYPTNGRQDALSLNEVIAASGVRTFLLCKKQSNQETADDETGSSEMTAQKKTSCWKIFLGPLRNLYSLACSKF